MRVRVRERGREKDHTFPKKAAFRSKALKFEMCPPLPWGVCFCYYRDLQKPAPAERPARKPPVHTWGPAAAPSQ